MQEIRDTKWSYSDIFNKIEKMEAVKDSTKFNEIKPDIFNDLSRIRHGVVQKVKDCNSGRYSIKPIAKYND